MQLVVLVEDVQRFIFHVRCRGKIRNEAVRPFSVGRTVDLFSIIAVALIAAGVAAWSLRAVRRLSQEKDLLEQINTDLAGRAKLLEVSSLEAIVSFDSHGLIRGLNPRAEKLFGYAKAELFGRNILTLIPKLPSEGRMAGHRLETRRKDGAILKIGFRAERPERNNHTYLHTYLFFDDADPAIRAFDAEPPLSAMERVVERIVGEFEGPLTTINGYSELTLPAAEEDSAMRDSLKEIAAASDRASQVTHTLLAFTGKQAQPAEAVDINALLAGMAPEIRSMVGAEVRIETAPQPAVAVLNAESLREAIRMLCASADRRMGHGDRLEIWVNTQSVAHAQRVYSGELHAGVYCVLRIADMGRQLSEAAMAHLLEPLYLNREEVGVELSPIYGLIHRIGGRIDCSTSAQGTVVELFLPLAGSNGNGGSHKDARAPHG